MKELRWIGSSKKDLMKFPKEVIQEMGYALYYAQRNEHYSKTKSFRGYGLGVYEVTIEYERNAYRTIYIVSLDNTVYVVHCFQKKSKRGIKTPKKELEIITHRLKLLKSERNKR